MQLAPAPFWEQLLLENPWPLCLTLAAVAGLLWWHGRRISERRVLRTAVAAGVAAVLCWVPAALITTPREELVERTRRLVHATSPLDEATLRELIAPDARLYGAGRSGESWVESDHPGTLVRELSAAVQRWQIDGHWVLSVESEVSGSEASGARRGRTLMRVRTMVSGEWGNRPVSTRWLLTWTKDDHSPRPQWQVREVQWLELQGQPPMSGIWR